MIQKDKKIIAACPLVQQLIQHLETGKESHYLKWCHLLAEESENFPKNDLEAV